MNSAKDQGVSVKYCMDDRLRMALLKESSRYRKFWNEYGGEKVLVADHKKQEYLKNPVPKGEIRFFLGKPDPACPAAKVGFDFFHGLGSFDIAFNGPLPTGGDLKAVIDILNPYQRELPDNLPFYFHKYPPVAQLVGSPFDQRSAPETLMIHEHDYCVPPELAINQLKPWERLLRIDLRRSKKDIKNEIGRYLDRVDKLRKHPEACNCRYISGDGRSKKIDWSDHYALWQTDVSRARKEVWRALEIYMMRRGANKKTFNQIGADKELGMNVDAAKKAFARAYFLIEGRKYDNDKKLLKKVEKEELKRTCATCPDKPEHGGNCKEPCPDVLNFVTQDKVSQSKRLYEEEALSNLSNKSRK